MRRWINFIYHPNQRIACILMLVLSKSEAIHYFESNNHNIDVDALFKAEDTDGDGYVSWKEFSGPKGSEGPPSTPQKQQRQQQQPDPLEQAVAIFQQMDIDGDGKISKEELAATFEAMGEPMTDEFWTESDTNGDGFVSIQEFVGNTGREEL